MDQLSFLEHIILAADHPARLRQTETWHEVSVDYEPPIDMVERRSRQLGLEAARASGQFVNEATA